MFALALALAVTACGFPAVFDASTVARDAAGCPCGTFADAEPVTFEITVTNRTAAMQTLTFTSSQTSDFIVYRDGGNEHVWRWSDGKAFLQVVSSIELAPGESFTASVDWDQLDGDGSPVGPGDYEVQAFAPPGRNFARASFSIE